LRLLDDARLTEVPELSSCALCRGAFDIEGYPTIRADVDTPVVDVDQALSARTELDRYLRDIREHDAAHKIDDIDDIPLPRGVRGSE
jgi:hypothetical protein